MRRCKICNGGFKANEKIAVIAYPISCLSNTGNYNVFGDFIDKEVVCHIGCFTNAAKDLILMMKGGNRNSIIKEQVKANIDKFYNKKPDNTFTRLVPQIRETLDNIGENVTNEKIKEFLSQNQEIKTVEGFVTTWLEKRTCVQTKTE